VGLRATEEQVARIFINKNEKGGREDLGLFEQGRLA
jgi:hypothetical protein